MFWKDGDTIVLWRKENEEYRKFDKIKWKWTHQWDYYRYYVKDGCIEKEQITGEKYWNSAGRGLYGEKMKEWVVTVGYNTKMGDWKIFRAFVSPFVGKTVSDAEKTILAYEERRKKMSDKRRQENEEWKELREMFDACVIGLDQKNYDVYSSGFSVRVLLSTKDDFESRRKFVKENKLKLVKWTMEQIENHKRLMGKIGDLRFYKPVEVVTLKNSAEVEIKFQIKNMDVFGEEAV